MEQRNFKKHFKLHNFSEIFYCDMSRLKTTNLKCFYTMSIYKNHFKKQRYRIEQEGTFKIPKI